MDEIDAEPLDAGTIGDRLEVWAGAPAPSPPYIVVALIVLVAIIGPILFVHIGVPSVLLTAMALLLPLAAAFAVAGTIGDWRRYHGDRAVRIRAWVTGEGVTLCGRRDQNDPYPWAEIADARVNLSSLILHLHSESGGQTRQAVRFSRLQTPATLIEARLQAGVKSKK